MRKMLLWVGLVLVFSSTPIFAITESNFEPSPCPFLVVAPEIDGQTIVCGYLTVPESRNGLSDKTIQLAVAIIKSTSATPSEPTIYFEGGPGGSALVSATSYWVESALREYGDIVLFDQRGTGYSTPSLNCVEYDDDTIADPDLECYKRLVAEGVALGAYTSAESASDVAELIRSLGYAQVNIYGISYGTRLALTVMRDYPAQIRSAILEGVYPPNVQGYEEEAANALRAFEQVFIDCEASLECNRTYPKLRETFFQMIDNLNNDPMNGIDIFGSGYSIYGDEVVNALFLLLYDTYSVPYIPALITAASQRDFETYSALGGVEAVDVQALLPTMTDAEFDAYMMNYLGYFSLQEYYDYVFTLTDEQYDALVSEVYQEGEPISDAEQTALDAKLMTLTDTNTVEALDAYLDNLSEEEYALLLDTAYGDIDDDSEGMYNSVECYEEVHFNTPEQVTALAEGIDPLFAPIFTGDLDAMQWACDAWSVDPSPALENEAVTSDIPTLILNGQYDPITPPSWGQVAGQSLPNSFEYTFPGMGHGVVDLDACPTDIFMQFITNPTQAPNDACIRQMPAPDFYLGDGEG